MPRSRFLRESWRRPLGELALIVTGVLLALWIEEWRQARIDRATEIEYLSRLTIDLDEDIADLENQIAHTRMRDENALAALAFLDSDRVVGDRSLVRALNRAGFISFFRYNRSTIDDLLSTGSLSLLRDKQLVRQLNNYYRAADFLSEFDDEKKRSIWGGYRVALSRHIPGRLLAEMAADSDATDLSTVSWEALRADSEVRSGLGQTLAIAAVERRGLEQLLEAAGALQATVGAELSARSRD